MYNWLFIAIFLGTFFYLLGNLYALRAASKRMCWAICGSRFFDAGESPDNCLGPLFSFLENMLTHFCMPFLLSVLTGTTAVNDGDYIVPFTTSHATFAYGLIGLMCLPSLAAIQRATGCKYCTCCLPEGSTLQESVKRILAFAMITAAVLGLLVNIPGFDTEPYSAAQAPHPGEPRPTQPVPHSSYNNDAGSAFILKIFLWAENPGNLLSLRIVTWLGIALQVVNLPLMIFGLSKDLRLKLGVDQRPGPWDDAEAKEQRAATSVNTAFLS